MVASDLAHENFKKRIEGINRMILELASGNFTCMIERSEYDDELEGIVVGLNMMTEELKASLINRSYASPENSNVVGLVFIIDENLIVKSVNSKVFDTLFFDVQEVQNQPLANFVTTASQPALEALKSKLQTEDSYSTIPEICFKTKGSLVVPTSCSVSALLDAHHGEKRFIVLAIETVVLNKVADQSPENSPTKTNTRPGYIHEHDYEKIKLVHSTIQDLQTQWSLALLASKVGMEKRTLTKMFKEYYNKPVMTFLLEKRMQKAKQLLETTDMALKEIASAIGYKSISTFSLRFKKIFGLTPKAVRGNALNKDG